MLSAKSVPFMRYRPVISILCPPFWLRQVLRLINTRGKYASKAKPTPMYLSTLFPAFSHSILSPQSVSTLSPSVYLSLTREMEGMIYGNLSASMPVVRCGITYRQLDARLQRSSIHTHYNYSRAIQKKSPWNLKVSLHGPSYKGIFFAWKTHLLAAPRAKQSFSIKLI